MGFHEFSSPYDWSRIASYKRTAKAAYLYAVTTLPEAGRVPEAAGLCGKGAEKAVF